MHWLERNGVYCGGRRGEWQMKRIIMVNSCACTLEGGIGESGRV